jgi:hypothetical protein
MEGLRISAVEDLVTCSAARRVIIAGQDHRHQSAGIDEFTQVVHGGQAIFGGQRGDPPGVPRS